MVVEVIPTWQTLRPKQLAGRAAVVVDVLRATTTIITVLANDCRAVYPVSSPGEARQLYNSLPGMMKILAGEQKGGKIPEFPHGNSPLEYPREEIAGKSLVLTTSNGTKALRKSANANASQVLVMALANVRAVGEYLTCQDKDIVIVCAGTGGSLSLEDTLAAGALLDFLRERGLSKAGNDLALASLELFRAKRGCLGESLSDSTNGRNLYRLGKPEDVFFCAVMNRYDVVPVFAGGKVTLLFPESAGCR